MMNNLLENGSLRFTLILLLVLPALVLVSGCAAATQVTGPMVITEPGTYELQQDITAGQSGVCIEVRSSDVTIEGNGHTIEGSETEYSCGVLVHGSGPLSHVTVQNLHISDWFYGVYYWDGSGAIQGNSLSGNTYGVVLNPGGGSTISGNTITAGDYGMVLASSSSPISVTGNTLAQNGLVGLYLYAVSQLSITNNYLDCDQDMLTGGSVSGVTWNTPKKSGTSISGGATLGGNFWAAPSGKGYSQTMTDTDHDGICDRSYVLGDGMFDEFPLHAPSGPPSPVSAGFSVSDTTGEIPFSVQFLDTSTGLPTQWLWLFGDGESATVQNPVHVYTEPGVYTVTLQAGNSVGQDYQVMNRLITVSGPPQKPVADFRGTPEQGTAPLSVQFIDTTTGDPTGWEWDFGDDTVSSDQSPVHTYTEAGTYRVTLTALNSAGQSVMVKQDLITVSSAVTAPIADFRVSADEGTDPLTVTFTDRSTGDPTSWYWNFGDGETSHEQNPTHTYHGARAYTVSLQARNDGGSNVVTKEDLVTVSKAAAGGDDQPTPTPAISVTPTGSTPAGGLLQARFSLDQTSGSDPLTVQFTDLSTGNPTAWYWNFGDGETSHDQNPIHIYRGARAYTVSLQARTADDRSVVTKEDVLTVTKAGTQPAVTRTPTPVQTATATPTGSTPAGGPLQARFSLDHTSGSDPLTVQFTDLSTGNPTAWYWNFGDGETSHDQNPTHTYHGARAYTVSLQARTADDRSVVTKEDVLTVTKAGTQPAVTQTPAPTPTPTAGSVAGSLQARFSLDRTSGSDPLTVQFTDLSTGNPTAWYWNFGDGETSREQNPMHIFRGARAYTVSLQARTADERAVVTKEDVLTVTKAGTQPAVTQTPTPTPTAFSEAGPIQAQFRATPPFGQNPLTVQFTDLSTGNPTSWYWNFGDGETSREQNPVHTYHGSRSYTVSMHASNADDESVTTMEDIVMVGIPDGWPLASCKVTPVSGTGPLSVQFTDTSTGNPTSWYWSFGDGSESTLQNPVHVYTRPGTYSVGFRAKNSKGSTVQELWNGITVR